MRSKPAKQISRATPSLGLLHSEEDHDGAQHGFTEGQSLIHWFLRLPALRNSKGRAIAPPPCITLLDGGQSVAQSHMSCTAHASSSAT